MQSETARVFEPIDDGDIYSAERCQGRDVTRRMMAAVLSRTPEELLEAVTEESAANALLDLLPTLSDHEKHVRAEADLTKAAAMRVLWAVNEIHGEKAAQP